jgi:hypothetical protein
MHNDVPAKQDFEQVHLELTEKPTSRQLMKE